MVSQHALPSAPTEQLGREAREGARDEARQGVRLGWMCPLGCRMPQRVVQCHSPPHAPSHVRARALFTPPPMSVASPAPPPPAPDTPPPRPPPAAAGPRSAPAAPARPRRACRCRHRTARHPTAGAGEAWAAPWRRGTGTIGSTGSRGGAEGRGRGVRDTIIRTSRGS